MPDACLLDSWTTCESCQPDIRSSCVARGSLSCWFWPPATRGAAVMAGAAPPTEPGHEGTGVCGWGGPVLAPAHSFPPRGGWLAPCVPPAPRPGDGLPSLCRSRPETRNSPGRRGCPAGAGPATRVPGLGSEPYGRRDTLAVSDLTHSGPISMAVSRGVQRQPVTGPRRSRSRWPRLRKACSANWPDPLR